jgi:hypothetical protein
MFRSVELVLHPGAADGEVLDAEGGGDVEGHAVAEEVVQSLRLGTRKVSATRWKLRSMAARNSSRLFEKRLNT